MEYIGICWAIFGCLWLSLAISNYLWLSLAISGYLWLYLAISGYLGLSRAISGYLRLQVEVGESKLLLFETFSLAFFFSSHERFLEELALLKTSMIQE